MPSVLGSASLRLWGQANPFGPCYNDCIYIYIILYCRNICEVHKYVLSSHFFPQTLYCILHGVVLHINIPVLYVQDPEKQLKIKSGFFSRELTFQPTR